MPHSKVWNNVAQPGIRLHILPIFLPLICAFCMGLAKAQTGLPVHHVQVVAGKSTHGTGDIGGTSFSTRYTRYVKKKLSWTLALGGTIHDGAYPLFYTLAGNPVDGSYRFTTAGMQVAGYAGYNFTRSRQHEFIVRLGPVLRYQSSSYFDDLSIFYPLSGTGFPFPVIVLQNRTPQRSYALGGSGQLQYNYMIYPKISIGIGAGLQTDTNGDTISELTLSVGKRL